MKIALLSDIHANRQALDACLQHARAHGAEQFALLGDLVGYGGEPVAVVEQVRDLAQQGALCVLGNHDAMALAPPANPRNRSELGAPECQTSPGKVSITGSIGLRQIRKSLDGVCLRCSIGDAALSNLAQGRLRHLLRSSAGPPCHHRGVRQ